MECFAQGPVSEIVSTGMNYCCSGIFHKFVSVAISTDFVAYELHWYSSESTSTPGLRQFPLADMMIPQFPLLTWQRTSWLLNSTSANQSWQVHYVSDDLPLTSAFIFIFVTSALMRSTLCSFIRRIYWSPRSSAISYWRRRSCGGSTARRSATHLCRPRTSTRCGNTGTLRWSSP